MDSQARKESAPNPLEGTTIELVYCHELPNTPGFKLATLQVTYAPGASTPTHRHGQAFVSAVVLSGSVQSQVNDGPLETFRAGQSWKENPGDVHTVSRNASETESASFMATFVAPTEQEQFVIFDCPACKVVKESTPRN